MLCGMLARPCTMQSGTRPITDAKQYFSWLRAISPGFQVHGKQIEIMQEPKTFYNRLKVRLKYLLQFEAISLSIFGNL